MKWFGLVIDGEIQYVMKREEKPDVRDFHLVFGIAINEYLTNYEVVEVNVNQVGCSCCSCKE